MQPKGGEIKKKHLKKTKQNKTVKTVTGLNNVETVMNVRNSHYNKIMKTPFGIKTS